MATNLDPASSVFTTVNMLSKGNEDGTEEFFDNLAENTGFNWLGTALKPNVSYGQKTIDISSNGATTTIDFGDDKTEGVADFSGVAYVVFLQITSTPTWGGANNGTNFVFQVSSKATGSFVVTYRYDTVIGNNPWGANPTVDWLAFGI